MRVSAGATAARTSWPGRDRRHPTGPVHAPLAAEFRGLLTTVLIMDCFNEGYILYHAHEISVDMIQKSGIVS